jgi:serine/threonine protein phosphatase PrpC
MTKSEKELQELIRLFGWKLYLEPPSKEFQAKWDNFIQDPDNQNLTLKIRDALTKLAQQSFDQRLNINQSTEFNLHEQDISEINKLWTEILEWLINEPSLYQEEERKNLQVKINWWLYLIKKKLKPKLSVAISQAVDIHLQEQEKKKSEPPENIATSSIIKPASEPIATWQPEQQTARQPTNETINQTNQNDVSVNEEQQKNQVNTPLAVWKYFPISEHEPDKYEEYIYKSEKSPEGLNLIGARVRGKMHKHNGTNCDDWFESTVSGKWTIIAVSDGAGSKKLSRIGAKVSCQAAVKYLSENLENHHIKEGITHAELSTGEDINDIKNILHQAMQTAYQAVENKAKECENVTDYFIALDNRRPEIKDFSATLLLAVHTTIKVEENNYNLVLTCQVGDGMLAAISQAGTLKLLGKPDTGEYAGQTDFLTSKNKLEASNLAHKTFHFLGNLKCLMVMTDGVADDYFPNDPGMLELYGDLVLNQIINIPKFDESVINQQLLKTNLGSINSIRDVKHLFQATVDRIIDPNLENQPDKILISSVADYAKELNKEITDVVDSPELLAAGILAESMGEQYRNMSTAEKLLLWLDSYYQKGSFDDRTLVVLYQEV